MDLEDPALHRLLDRESDVYAGGKPAVEPLRILSGPEADLEALPSITQGPRLRIRLAGMTDVGRVEEALQEVWLGKVAKSTERVELNVGGGAVLRDDLSIEEQEALLSRPWSTDEHEWEDLPDYVREWMFYRQTSIDGLPDGSEVDRFIEKWGYDRKGARADLAIAKERHQIEGARDSTAGGGVEETFGLEELPAQTWEEAQAEGWFPTVRVKENAYHTGNIGHARQRGVNTPLMLDFFWNAARTGTEVDGVQVQGWIDKLRPHLGRFATPEQMAARADVEKEIAAEMKKALGGKVAKDKRPVDAHGNPQWDPWFVDVVRHTQQKGAWSKEQEEAAAATLSTLLGRNVEPAAERTIGNAVDVLHLLVAAADEVKAKAAVSRTGARSKIDEYGLLRALRTYEGIVAWASGRPAHADTLLRKTAIGDRMTPERRGARIDAALEKERGVFGERILAASHALAETDDLLALHRQAMHYGSRGSGARKVEAAVWESLINGVLFRPLTMSKAFAGNMILHTQEVGAHFMATDAATGWGEAQMMNAATMDAVREGFILANQMVKRQWMRGEAATEDLGTDAQNAMVADAMQSGTKLVDTGSMNSGAIENLLLDGFRLIGREQSWRRGAHVAGNVMGKSASMGLQWMDLLAKTTIYRQEVAMAAYRRAHELGLEGDEFKAAVALMRANPDIHMHEAAIRQGELATLTSPLGKWGRGGEALHAKGMKYGVLFWRTPANAVKHALRLTPLAPALADFRADWHAGGLRRKKAMARMELGSALLLAGWAAQQEGLFSGGGLIEPDMERTGRTLGEPRYSIRFGDEGAGWRLQFAGFDPVITPIMMGADASQLFEDFLTYEGEDKATAAMMAGLALAYRTVDNTMWTADAFEFIDAVTRVREDGGAALGRWAKRTGRQMLPLSGLSRQAKDLVDPVQRQTRWAARSRGCRSTGWSS